MEFCGNVDCGLNLGKCQNFPYDEASLHLPIEEEETWQDH